MKHLNRIFMILAIVLGASLNSYAADSFTMIIASDSQFPWWRSNNDLYCQGEVCVKQQGIATNTSQVNAMNNIQTTKYYNDGAVDIGIWPNVPNLTTGGGTPIKKPVAVIMNGDLTAFWHSWQYEMYQQFYDPGYSDAIPGVLNLDIFPGLGNHDYKNNVDDCGWPNKNDCAEKAIAYIKDMVNSETVENFNPYVVQSFDSGSLAYSFEINDYHFVQLHNYPTYEDQSIDISTSISWLATDLANASARNKKIVINMHNYDDWKLPTDKTRFLDAIRGQNVVALFAGHIHKDHGKEGDILEAGTTIPYFRSGASEYYTSLLVEFGDTYINVGVIDSEVWSGQFQIPNVAVEKSIALVEYIVKDNNMLYAFWNDDNDEGIYYSIYKDTLISEDHLPPVYEWRWSPQQRINMVVTKNAPSVTVYHDELYIVWNSSDNKGIYYSSLNNTTWEWSPAQRINEVVTKNAPAIAVYGGKLYAAWNGFNNEGIYYASFEDGIWSSSSKIEGVLTNDAPALTSHDGKLYAAWNRSDDGGIYYASFDGTWSSSSKISKIFTKGTPAPALASHNGKLYAAWNGPDGENIFYASFKNGTWSNSLKANITSLENPGSLSLASFKASVDRRLYLGWANDGVFYASLSDGPKFLEPTKSDNLATYTLPTYTPPSGDGSFWTIQSRIKSVYSEQAPAYASFDNKLYAVWNGHKNNGIYYASFDGIRWSSQKRINKVVTKDVPSVAVYDNELYVVWNGSDNKGIHYSSFDGTEWSPQETINEAGTKDAPSIAVYGDKLYASWNGYSEDGIFYASFGGIRWSRQLKISDDSIKDAPALAAYDGKLYAAWNGPDDEGIFYASFNGSWSNSSEIGNVSTKDAPALAAYNGKLYAAWNGSNDEGIYYASFEEGAWSPSLKTNIDGLENSGAPSLGSFNNRLYLGWANDGIRTANYVAW